MRSYEKVVGLAGTGLGVVGIVVALLGYPNVSLAVGLSLLLLGIFYVVQVLRSVRRTARSVQLARKLQKSERSDMAALMRAMAATRELQNSERGDLAVLRHAVAEMDERDREERTLRESEIDRLVKLLEYVSARVRREGAAADLRHRQARNRSIADIERLIKTVNSAKGAASSAVDVGVTAIREDIRVISGKIIAQQDGVRNTVEDLMTSGLASLGEENAQNNARVLERLSQLDSLENLNYLDRLERLSMLDDLGQGQAALDARFEELGQHVGEQYRSVKEWQEGDSDRVSGMLMAETQEVEALFQLYSEFTPRAQMPPLGKFDLGPQSMLSLRQLVLDHRPRMIVAFGGGASTVWLGYLCEELGAHLVHIAPDAIAAGRTESLVEAHGLSESVEVRLGQLETIEIGGEEYSWFARGAYSDLEGVGMMVVADVPAAVAEHAQFIALPLMRSHLAPDAVSVFGTTGGSHSNGVQVYGLRQ